MFTKRYTCDLSAHYDIKMRSSIFKGVWVCIIWISSWIWVKELHNTIFSLPKKEETEIFPTQKGTFANYTISMYYLQHIRICCNLFESFPYAWFVSIIHLSYQFTSVCVSLIISGNLFWHSFVLTVYTNPKLLSLRTPYKHELNFSMWRSNCKLQ